MSAHPKVLLVQHDETGEWFAIEKDAEPVIDFDDCTVTECVAVPVAELAALTAERDALAARVEALEPMRAWVEELGRGEFVSPFKRDPMAHAKSHIAHIAAKAEELAAAIARASETGVHTQNDMEGGTDA